MKRERDKTRLTRGKPRGSMPRLEGQCASEEFTLPSQWRQGMESHVAAKTQELLTC